MKSKFVDPLWYHGGVSKATVMVTATVMKMKATTLAVNVSREYKIAYSTFYSDKFKRYLSVFVLHCAYFCSALFTPQIVMNWMLTERALRFFFLLE